MHLIKLFALTAAMMLTPLIASASAGGTFPGPGDFCIVFDNTLDCDLGDMTSGDFSAPIPEPTSALLMIAGFATIAGVRRMRR